MPPLNLALIGCGQIGRVHAQRLLADGRAKLASLCDPLPENAASLRAEFFPQALATTNLDQALSHPGLHGVIIATPTHLHADQVRAALAKNLPVLCEKPLADSREDILDLIRLAEAPGAPPLVVGYQRRFWATYRTLKREVDSGRWGSLRAFQLHNSEDWQQCQALPGTWRNDPLRNPAGYIGDAGSHKLDMLFHLTGRRPVELAAHIDHCNSPIPIRATVTARLQGDIPVSLSLFGDAHHFREDLHIILDRADLVLRDDQLFLARDKQLQPLTDLEPDSDATLGFLDILSGKLTNPAPPRCALDVHDLTTTILQAARQQSKLSLS